MEGATPKLPGAFAGVQVMTPQQFVAKSAEGEEPGPEQDVAEGAKQVWAVTGTWTQRKYMREPMTTTTKVIASSPEEAMRKYKSHMWNEYERKVIDMKVKPYVNQAITGPSQGVAEESDKQFAQRMKKKAAQPPTKGMSQKEKEDKGWAKPKGQGVAEGSSTTWEVSFDYGPHMSDTVKVKASSEDEAIAKVEKAAEKRGRSIDINWVKPAEQGVAEAAGDLLGAQTRPLGGQEFQDYMDRIANREKGKTDKYKLPYIHRSSVIKYYSEEGKRYDEGQIIEALKQRPKKLLKQNEKMKHSNGELEQFFNIGFAALVGVAVNEAEDSLVIVNTCPGAGSCKVDCFAMKGGKVQFEGPWLSDGRILTYLLNDPEGFFNQLSAEIAKEEKAGQKGGYKVTIRWHDAGDFFSPEYVDMAFKLANKHPNVQFYAYTKMGDVAVGQKPKNFIINWSEGAHTSQEKKVKAADPNLERTKNSRIVPSTIFYDLLVKDEKKNLVKGPEGQWQVIPDKLPELKQRIAKEYGISSNSILSYDEWDQKTDGGKKETPVKYNVIITPGEPDITAKSHGVLSTLLLKH